MKFSGSFVEPKPQPQSGWLNIFVFPEKAPLAKPGDQVCPRCGAPLQVMGQQGEQLAFPILYCPYFELWEETGFLGRGFLTAPCGYVGQVINA